MTRALVVGYGSIGERHARIIAELGHDVAVVSRRAVSHPKTFSVIADAVRAFNPDYAVVANETSAHRSVIAALAASGFSGTTLVEKPLVERVAPGDETVRPNTFVAYNLRFHPLVLRLREWLRTRRVVGASIHVGQHLSTWRPGRDMRETYSARSELGGGVLRDLSHELDLAIWLFGGARRVAAVGGASGVLGIDADDYWSIVAELERCPQVSIVLNYLDDPPRRQIIVNSDSGTAQIDLLQGRFEESGKPSAQSVRVGRDDLYRSEHQAMLSGSPAQTCTYSEGIAVVRLIETIEEAARDRRWAGK